MNIQILMKWCCLAALTLIFLGSPAATARAAAPNQPPAKPNIIVILVDDMGFSDIGCYGSEIPTPNLDKLAAGGLRFTQFYNIGRCCPTRASLLTGLYPHQAGIGHMMEKTDQPGYLGQLNDKCVTIAEVLKQAGYFTAMTGKWHIGQGPNGKGATPWGRGFDRSLNAVAGGFYFPESGKAQLYLNGKELKSDDPVLPQNWYSTDLWTDYGIKFIDEALQEKKPFYLHLCHNAPHFPLQAPQDEIARFRGKYKAGWDKLRQQRYEKQIALGIVDKAGCALSPRPEKVKAWESLTPEEQDRFDQIMAIYAATVAHMDTAVGRLVEALQARGVLDNTLILFMSDNGGNAESGPDGICTGSNPGSVKSKVFCGQSWASLENTPLRYYKHYNHEGGVATPLIAHWPAKIKDAGSLRWQPGHLIDVMATCVDVSGAKYPSQFNGKPIFAMEGKSLVPAFENKAIERDALYWEHEGNAAIRVDDWKLVRRGPKGPWELYDMKNDRSELHDLAAQKPELVKSMAAKWEAWSVRAQVVPRPEKGSKKKGNKNTGKEKSQGSEE